MAGCNDMLLTHYLVKQINIKSSGFSLWADALESELRQSEAMLLALSGCILITNDAVIQNQLQAVQELQFRQDEMDYQFGIAINQLISGI